MAPFIQSASETNVGLKRQNNEDAYLVDDQRGVYAVADGMGGRAAGEIASKIAIQTLDTRCGGRCDALFMKNLFGAAHANILADMKTHPERAGMGTTLTALIINPVRARIAHVGDSRCYLVRAGVGKQLTTDHTLQGTTKEPVDPQWRHVLLNCLGSKPSSHTQTDTDTLEVFPGDVFVLCSDGLADYADADAIARFTTAARTLSPPAEFCANLAAVLVKHALDNGGKDNVTVIVVSAGAQ